MLKYIYLFVLIFVFNLSNAQYYTVSGTVTNSRGEILPGVSITIAGTSKGSISDFNGKFRLSNVKRGSNLQFSYVGYKTKKITINSNKNLNVVLQQDRKKRNGCLTRIGGKRFYLGIRTGAVFNFGESAKGNIVSNINTPNGISQATLIPKENSKWQYKPWKILNPEPWFQLRKYTFFGPKGNTGARKCNISSTDKEYGLFFNFDFSNNFGIMIGFTETNRQNKTYFFTDIPEYPHYLLYTKMNSTGIPLYLKFGNMNMQTYFYTGFQYNQNYKLTQIDYIGGESFKFETKEALRFRESNTMFVVGAQAGLVHMEFAYMGHSFLNQYFEDGSGTKPYANQRNSKLYFNAGMSFHLQSDFLNQIRIINSKRKKYHRVYPDSYLEYTTYTYRSIVDIKKKQYPEMCDKVVWTMPIINSSLTYNIDSRFVGFRFGIEHSNYGIRQSYDPFNPNGFLDENRVLALGTPITLKLFNNTIYFGGVYFWNYLHSRKQSFVLNDEVKKFIDINSAAVNRFTPAVFIGINSGNMSFEIIQLTDNFLNAQYTDPDGIQPFQLYPGKLLFFKIGYHKRLTQ